MKINLTAKATTITHTDEKQTHVLTTKSDWRNASTMLKMRLGLKGN